MGKKRVKPKSVFFRASFYASPSIALVRIYLLHPLSRLLAVPAKDDAKQRGPRHPPGVTSGEGDVAGQGNRRQFLRAEAG